MRSIITILVATAVGGCVVYDENLVYEDTAVEPLTTDGPDRPGDSTDDPASGDALSLFPAGGLQGDITILSLCADGVNLNDIVDATFLGQSTIDIISTGRRGEGEFLMTVEVPANSQRSTNHLLLDLANGTTLFLEDAFQVVANAADIPVDSGVDGSCE